MQNYVRITKLSDIGGRADYISNPNRQEHIVTASPLVDWKPYQGFERNNQKSTEPNNEGREIIVALPNEWADRSSEWQQRNFAEIACSLVGKETDLQWAVHWNSKKSNLHMHIVFSERTMEERGVYDRDIYHTTDGKVARSKAQRARDKDGNIKPPVHRKGDSQGGFSVKDTQYKAIDWQSKVKVKALQELVNRGVEIESKNLLHEYHEGKGKDAPVIRAKNVLIRKSNASLNKYLAEKGQTVDGLPPARAKKYKLQMLDSVSRGKWRKWKQPAPLTPTPPKVISQPAPTRKPTLPQPQPKITKDMDFDERMKIAKLRKDEQNIQQKPTPVTQTDNTQRTQQTPAWNTEYMKTLHKRKKWSELTPDERQAVRKLSVNASAFDNRQDFLDMKKHFKAGLDKAR